MQVVDAPGGDRRAVCCLGQNERALDCSLRVEREAFRCPLRMHATLAHGFFYIRDKDPRVAGDSALAGLTEGRMRVVDLLHHGSCQTGEVGEFAAQQSFAKIHIRQQAVERVGMVAVGRGSEKSFRAFNPIVDGGQGQPFLAFEVIEEAALGEPGSLADVLDARSGVALGADDVHGRTEEPGLRFVSGFELRFRWSHPYTYRADSSRTYYWVCCQEFFCVLLERIEPDFFSGHCGDTGSIRAISIPCAFVKYQASHRNHSQAAQLLRSSTPQ